MEPVLKLLGALGVLLYVMGLVISNLQLMELGISEFASFNLRNATTGFIFLVWIALIFLLTSPASLFLILVLNVLAAKITLRRRLLIILVGLLLAAVATMAAVEIAGRTMRYVYPWGSPWSFFETPGSLRDFLMLKSMQEAWGFVMEGFGHAKAITAGAALMVFQCFLYFRPVSDWLASNTKLGFQKETESFRDLTKALLVAAPLVLLTLMSAFAIHVLPNIRGNIGGHQPQIAELGLAGIGPYETETLGLSVSAGKPSIGTAHDTGGAAASGEFAIWHQSDKFLYVMPLGFGQAPASNPTRNELVALDITMVKTIKYLGKFARIVDGSHIAEVGLAPGARRAISRATAPPSPSTTPPSTSAYPPAGSSATPASP